MIAATSLLLLIAPAGDGPAPLPSSWHGTYAGMFSVEGDSAVDPFRGELRIAPIEGSASVSWTLIYGEGEARQVRPYELVPVPGAPGRFA